MRVRTSWIALAMLTAGCGGPTGRPGGSWERPTPNGMTLEELACNRNGECQEEEFDPTPPPVPPTSEADRDDEEHIEGSGRTPAAASAEAHDSETEHGGPEAAEESEDPRATPPERGPSTEEHGAPDSPEGQGTAEDEQDSNEGQEFAEEPEANRDGGPPSSGQPDGVPGDAAPDPTETSEGPAHGGGDAHRQRDDAEDADVSTPEAPTTPSGEEDADHGRDDCRQRCDFNADCPAEQPLCVYGRCFAEADGPFEP